METFSAEVELNSPKAVRILFLSPDGVISYWPCRMRSRCLLAVGVASFSLVLYFSLFSSSALSVFGGFTIDFGSRLKLQSNAAVSHGSGEHAGRMCRNLRIYYVQTRHLVSGSSNIWVRCVTPHSSPARGYWYQQTILIFMYIFTIINLIQFRYKIAQYYYFAGFSLHPCPHGVVT